MREKWIIANWKMNLGLMASAKLAKILSKKYAESPLFSRLFHTNCKTNIIVCPSFTAILEVAKFLERSPIALGAQDMFWQERGAFTGEISPLMLMEVGVDYVILGHSERRQYLLETDQQINRKVRTAVHYGLVPILCVGETLTQRHEGQTQDIVFEQLEHALREVKVSDDQLVILAYEPVWSIGTGQPVHPEEVAEIHAMIKQYLYEKYPESIVNHHFKIIYGGSVDAHNVAQYTHQSNVDGVLVGGASLRSKEFLNLIAAVRKS